MKACSFDLCNKRPVARGYCTGHYQQFKRGVELTPITPRVRHTVSTDGRKVCSGCGARTPIDDFATDSRTHDGFTSRCKACKRAYENSRYPFIRDRVSRYGKENRAKIYSWEVAYRQAHRSTAIEIYGGKCVQCGSTESLEFDHVNNDGAVHRAIETQPSMLKRIADTGQRITDFELQLLCRFHNRSKGNRYVGVLCPG